MTNELIKILLILSVGQGLTFATLLLFKKKGVLWANRFLAIFIILTVIPLWNDYIFLLNENYLSLRISFSWLYMPAFYGPLLYLYTLTYTRGPKPEKTITLLLAVIPVIGVIIKLTHTHFTVSGLSHIIWMSWYLIIYIQILICLYASWRRLNQFESELRENLSNLDKAKTDWLQKLLFFYLFILLVGATQTIAKTFSFESLEIYGVLVTISEAVFIFALGFWGLNKSEVIFHDIVVKDKKYSNSVLTHAKAERVLNKLTTIMSNEELYLDNEISLVTLAKKIEETPHHLSQVINERLQQNFYDYVNSARVEHAKKILANPGFKKLPIIDIAYQVGFNNKTSFNNSFKKYTQLTPSQYRSSIH